MFIPIHLNLPLLLGGFIAYLVQKKGGNEAQEKGTLVASGFIAGGALMGVVSAVIKFAGADWFMTEWSTTTGAQVLGIVMYIALIGYFYQASIKKHK